MGRRLVRLPVVVCVVIGLMGPAIAASWAADSERHAYTAMSRSVPVAQAGLPESQSLEGVESKSKGEPSAEAPAKSGGFTIKQFVVEGSTLLPPSRIDEILEKYKGSGKQMTDLEHARAELEKAYQSLGYPTIIVSIPEQSIEEGIIRLQVVEGRLFDIRVTGNKYYPRWQILDKLPSLRTGVLLDEKALVKELDRVNVNPDLKVTPVLKAGTVPGTVDLELKVKDRLPLHARLTGDNKGPFTTPANRLTAEVSYSNLWQQDHILTFQTTQTPTDWGAVQGYSGTYVAPITGPQHALAVYVSKVLSDSTLEGSTLAVSPGAVLVAGNATIAGLRYFFPILEGGTSTHTITLGIDYKRLEETEATFPEPLGTATVLGPIQYLPLSGGYSSVYPDSLGITLFSATAKGYWGFLPGGEEEDFGGDPNDPFNKPGQRKGSTGKFVVVQGAMDRAQPLPLGFNLALHVDGQWASEPLVPMEAYFAGGADTVRGYIQSESIGDYAVRGRVELTTPNVIDIPIDWIWQRRKSSEVKIEWKLATFYDAANLWTADAPAGQRDQVRLEGVGGGLRARLAPYNFTFHFDQGVALSDANATRSGDTFAHFMVSFSY